MSSSDRPLHIGFRVIAGVVALAALVDEVWSLLASPSSPLSLHIGRVALGVLFGYVAITGAQLDFPNRGESL